MEEYLTNKIKNPVQFYEYVKSCQFESIREYFKRDAFESIRECIWECI